MFVRNKFQYRKEVETRFIFKDKFIPMEHCQLFMTKEEKMKSRGKDQERNSNASSQLSANISLVSKGVMISIEECPNHLATQLCLTPVE